MKRFLTDIVYRNAYLLIFAAWLFTLSFIFSNYWSYSTSPQGVRKSLEKQLQQTEEDFETFLADTGLLHRCADLTASESEIRQVIDKPYGIFLYQQRGTDPFRMKFWNTQQSIPEEDMLLRKDGSFFVRLSNGQYEFIRRTLRTNKYDGLVVCALIPIRRDYFIENEYLQKGFAGRSDIEQNYAITKSPRGIPILNREGKVLYRIERKAATGMGGSDVVSVLLRLVATLLVLFYIHILAQGIAICFGGGRAVFFLITVIILLRALTYPLPPPFGFRGFDLFNPSIYGSGAILRTLGDLLINVLLFVWMMLFTQQMARTYQPVISFRDKRVRILVSAFICLLFTIAVFLSGDVIRSLVSDSAISYEVTNIFRLDGYSVVAFFVLGCISMGFFILSQVLLGYLNQFMRSGLFNKILMVVVMGLSWLTFFEKTENIPFGIGLLAWSVLYLLLSHSSGRTAEWRISGSSNVFWLVFFSASITALIFTENRKRELGIRKSAALKLAMQTDPSSDYLVNIITQGISNDFLLRNLPRFTDEVQANQIKDSIINAGFTGYTNKFDSRLFLFDGAGRPISDFDQLTYDTLNTIFMLQARKTALPDVRYFENDLTSFSYLFRREVKDASGKVVAHFFLLSNPRSFEGENLYPGLIRQSDDQVVERWPEYAYAVYDKLELKYQKRDYPFPISLLPNELPKEEFFNTVSGGYEILWYRPGPEKVVIIARKAGFLLEAITLFAYLFCASLLLVALFQLANLLLRTRLEGGFFQGIRNVSIRKQIYGTIIFLSIFSFLVIGAVTIVFFIQRYDRNNRDRLSRTIESMSEDLQERMRDRSLRMNPESLSDPGRERRIREALAEISEIYNADVNIYDAEGDLRVSSQPFVYSKGILSRKMEPLAYYQMRRQRRSQFVQDEQYGQLAYLSIYRPLRNRQLGVDAYINIPYFSSRMELRQEISNFLLALINLNAFIFLMAGVISVFITNRITRSFTWIGKKMEEVNLGRHNEEINWGRKDEIGGLVEQYNRMVRKLEDSALALAKTEREGAWREMARQVAHEIKNPLTPMKLSIQYLQKAIDSNAPNVRELSTRVAGTLVEQIDHLSRIAAEFSEFANIGQVKPELFDLHDVIQPVVSLFDMQERIEITWERLPEPVLVYADRTQLNRLLTNLIQNGIEAIPEDRTGSIVISESIVEKNYRLCIADNGAGISAAARKNIFVPNFTTKSSGTGLGLAMSKGIVEQARGSIWFETEEDRGTRFFVQLPLAKPEAGTEPGVAAVL